LRATKVFLYFSSAPVVPESIDQDQYKSLIEYRDRLRSEGVIFEYSSIGEFRDLVQRHLSSFMASIIKDSSADSQADISDQNNSQVEMFRSQIEAFLRRFEAEWAAERDSEPHNIEDAKYIVSSALDELSQLQPPKGGGLEPRAA